MNDCTHPLAADLKAFADGELPLGRRLLVRRHLTCCPACREELNTMRRIAETLRAAAPAPLTESLRTRLLSAAPADVPEPMPRPRRLRLAVGVGVAALACAATFFVLYPRGATLERKAASPLSLPALFPAESFSNPVAGADADDSVAVRFQAEAQGRAKSVPAESGKRAAFSQEFRTRANAVGTAGEARIVHTAGEARIVHRTATLAVAVEPGQVESKSEQAEQIAGAAGGFVASSNLTTSADTYRLATMELRIPERAFDTALKQLARLGIVAARNVARQDLTDSASDARSAESVLADAVRQAEEKLRRARSARSEWRREDELRDLRLRLAQNRAQLERLRSMGAFGEITLTLQEKEKGAPQRTSSGWLDGLGETNRQAAVAFQTAVRVPLVLGIWCLAFSPIWAPLLLLWRGLARRAG